MLYFTGVFVCACLRVTTCMSTCLFLFSQMHIVSLKKGLTPAQATADKEGIAVLGFFIDVSCSTVLTPHGVSVAQNPKPQFTRETHIVHIL